MFEGPCPLEKVNRMEMGSVRGNEKQIEFSSLQGKT